MDASAVNFNVTLDDFDSVLSYADQSVWTTPDPSPGSDFNATSSPLWMGTYHRTQIVGAEFSLNFTGYAVYIYGLKGPEYGTFEVSIDSNITTAQSYSAQNGSEPTLLFADTSLPYARHSLVVKNTGKSDTQGGDGFVLDSLQTSIQLAPAGAEVTNTTLEEDNEALTYVGEWGNNTSPAFSGGGSTYTNGDGASVSFEFNGSAVYVFGDKKNDHRYYSVVLDGGEEEIYNAISGCGGEFGMTCEQQVPTLKYMASNLNSSTHTLKVTNMAGVNQSYFDLDSIVITTPTEYQVRSDSGSGTDGGSGSDSGGDVDTDGALRILPGLQALLLVFLVTMWAFRKV